MHISGYIGSNITPSLNKRFYYQYVLQTSLSFSPHVSDKKTLGAVDFQWCSLHTYQHITDDSQDKHNIIN